VYNYIYIFLQDNSRWGPVRSAVWGVGVSIIMTLFIKAGNAAAHTHTLRL